METKNEFLEIKDLSVCYHAYDEVVKAVNHVSLSLEKGETLGLVGETGAGKTTTALSIMRLLPKRTGEVLNGEIIFNGQNLLSLPGSVLPIRHGSAFSDLLCGLRSWRG